MINNTLNNFKVGLEVMNKLKYFDKHVVSERMKNEMDIEISNSKPFSLPYAIALLDAIGFFNLIK